MFQGVVMIIQVMVEYYLLDFEMNLVLLTRKYLESCRRLET